VLYRRLIARGKSHTSAVVACARKLLIYANTAVARGSPWTSRESNGEAVAEGAGQAAWAAAFLGSAKSAVPSPRPPSQTPPRAALLKHGRRPPPLAARSVLDQREHGGRMKGSGGAKIARYDGCYAGRPRWGRGQSPLALA
jgi:hypothetical protein